MSQPDVQSPPAGAFEHQHLRVVTDKLLATADELQLSNQRLATLIEINLQRASERDPRRMLDSVCRAARDLIGARYALLAIGKRGSDETDHYGTAGSLIHPARPSTT